MAPVLKKNSASPPVYDSELSFPLLCIAQDGSIVPKDSLEKLISASYHSVRNRYFDHLLLLDSSGALFQITSWSLQTKLSPLHKLASYILNPRIQIQIGEIATLRLTHEEIVKKLTRTIKREEAFYNAGGEMHRLLTYLQATMSAAEIIALFLHFEEGSLSEIQKENQVSSSTRSPLDPIESFSIDEYLNAWRSQPALHALIEEWIRENTGESEDLNAGVQIFSMYRSHPASALAILIGIIQLAPTEEDMNVSIATGPLEDLLSICGPQLIDMLPKFVEKLPRLKILLGGVWTSGLDPEVAQMVERLRGEVW